MRRSRRGASLLFATGAALAAVAAPAQAWRAVFDGNVPSGDPVGFAMGVDVNSAGEVVAAGHLGSVSSNMFSVGVDVDSGQTVWTSDTPQILGTGHGMALDASDNILFEAYRNLPPPDTLALHVSKLSSVDRSVLWSYDAPSANGLSTTFPEQTLVATSGDVFACGHMEPLGPNEGKLTGALALRLDAATGAEVWRREDYAIDQLPIANCALSPAGPAFCYGAQIGTDYRVTLVDPATGADVWFSNGYGFDALAFDGAGDVYAAGFDGTATTVARLDGATGAEDWATAIGGSDPDVHAMALDAAGDVIVVGDGGAADVPTAWKFSGATGALLWTVEFDEYEDSGLDRLHAVVPRAPDVVFVGGNVEESGDRIGFLAALDSASGGELWRHLLESPMPGEKTSELTTLALSPAGHPLAAGAVLQVGSSLDFLVARVSGQVPGRKLLLKDAPGNPKKRKVQYQARGVDVIAPSPGGPADPTTVGATLTVYNPSTTETASMALPAANWEAQVSSSGFRGYRYRDSKLLDGPCKTVSWRVGRQLKVTCRGDAVGFSLDEVSQGSIAVALDAGAFRACSVFGGTLKRDTSTSSGNATFLAVKAEEVDACPVP